MAAAFPAHSHEIQCNPSGSQQELNVCAFEVFTIADDEMNRLYREQMAYLTQAPIKERLKAAQKAWLSYRDASCLYENGTREESGSIWPMAQSACEANLTRQRNLVLKEYIACRDNGCPY